MIRFIDIRGQDTGKRFAFYNTVTDKFIEVGGEMAWDTLKDFREICGFDEPMRIFGPEFFERCERLCPDWAKTEGPR